MVMCISTLTNQSPSQKQINQVCDCDMPKHKNHASFPMAPSLSWTLRSTVYYLWMIIVSLLMHGALPSTASIITSWWVCWLSPFALREMYPWSWCSLCTLETPSKHQEEISEGKEFGKKSNNGFLWDEARRQTHDWLPYYCWCTD